LNINFVKKIKIVHTFHVFCFNHFQNLLTKNFYILLEYLVAKISDKLIFVSKSNITTAIKYNIGNFKDYVLIRSGIKISEYKNIQEQQFLKEKILKELSLPLDSRIITTIGPFKPQKNLSDFIELAHIVTNSTELYTETKKKLFFLIAGDGDQRRMLEKLVEEYHLNDKIKFLSWYKNIAGLLSITEIFVMTSLWEGLPRSAVEALVSGVPVVAYNTDGLSDIIMSDFNGYLVRIKDVYNLSQYVIELLNNRTKLDRLKHNAKSFIDNSFDIDYMVRQQEDLYSSIINLVAEQK
jgi:glycosyltransferase involved in cell wall biosynthesis